MEKPVLQEVEKAFLELGWKRTGSYFRKGWKSIKVPDSYKLSEAFTKLIEFGKREKVREIKNMLDITDPRI